MIAPPSLDVCLYSRALDGYRKKLPLSPGRGPAPGRAASGVLYGKLAARACLRCLSLLAAGWGLPARITYNCQSCRDFASSSPIIFNLGGRDRFEIESRFFFYIPFYVYLKQKSQPLARAVNAAGSRFLQDCKRDGCHRNILEIWLQR